MRKVKAFLIIIGIVMLVVGCSKEGSLNVAQQSNLDSQILEQEPERMSDIYGMVKTVLGNEVSLSLAEYQDVTKLSEEEKEKKRNDMQSLSQEERQKIKNQQINYTGETASVIIPVGTPIISGNINSGQKVIKELLLSDVYEGMFLRIWLEEGGSGEESTAEFVRVLSPQ